jgi:hypothetical protein
MELIPERRPNGTVVLRVAIRREGPLRRLLRQLLGR